MKSFVCKKCSKKTKSVGGIRNHIRKKHGTKKVHKGIHFAQIEIDDDDKIAVKILLDTLGSLDSKVLANVIEGDHKLNPVQKAALDVLSRR